MGRRQFVHRVIHRFCGNLPFLSVKPRIALSPQEITRGKRSNLASFFRSRCEICDPRREFVVVRHTGPRFGKCPAGDLSQTEASERFGEGKGWDYSRPLFNPDYQTARSGFSDTFMYMSGRPVLGCSWLPSRLKRSVLPSSPPSLDQGEMRSYPLGPALLALSAFARLYAILPIVREMPKGRLPFLVLLVTGKTEEYSTPDSSASFLGHQAIIGLQ